VPKLIVVATTAVTQNRTGEYVCETNVEVEIVGAARPGDERHRDRPVQRAELRHVDDAQRWPQEKSRVTHGIIVRA
jgi:hypothetical protein